jgi:hypothetical protein
MLHKVQKVKNAESKKHQVQNCQLTDKLDMVGG